jgi:hypothetical protein
MKRVILISLILFSNLYFSQSWNIVGNSGTNSTSNFIGTTDDKDLILKTNNKERMRIFSGPYVNGIIIGNQGGSVNTERARLELVSVQCPGCMSSWAQPGDFVIRTREVRNLDFLMANNNAVDPNTDTSTPNSSGITRIRFADTVHKNSLIISNTGKVTVGTDQYDNDPNYIFYVKKGIKAEQIKVENPAVNGWADYVFKKDYKLKTIEEVEKHISENGHLPNIPSAKEVSKEGINLGEMDSKLLEKVEELTLYIIQLNKQVKQLEGKNKQLEERIEFLTK